MLDKMTPTDQKALERFFADYDCFPLPRPVDKESDLQRVEEMPYEALRDDFREEYAVLERQIFNAIGEPRQVAGRVITGDLLADMIVAFTDAISTKAGIVNELTQLPTQWQMVARISGERAVKLALKLYKSQIESLFKELPVSDKRLAEVHEDAWHEALEVFYTEALVEDRKRLAPEQIEFFELLEAAVRKWAIVPKLQDGECIMVQKMVSGAYYELWAKNAKLASEACQSTLKRLYEPIAAALKEFDTINDYRAEIEKVIKKKENKKKTTFSILITLIFSRHYFFFALLDAI